MIWHDDHSERVRLNHDFQERKDRVSGLAGQLIDDAKEGAINTLAVRRHLTTLETVLLETHHQSEAERARALPSLSRLAMVE